MKKYNKVIMMVCLFAMSATVMAGKFDRLGGKSLPIKLKKIIEGKLVNYTLYGRPEFDALGSHRNLCGPNDQLGTDTFEYSTQCCARDSNGMCVEEVTCRTPKAVCIDKDANGNAVGTYESFGTKDCGVCPNIDIDDPGKVITPGGF